MFYQKLYAFLKRDFLIHSSYKLSFLFSWMSVFVSLVTFYFIAQLMGKNVSVYLNDYGGEYFPFVLIGLAFSSYLGVASGSSAVFLREQYLGTLEAILLSPTKIYNLIIGMNLWNLVLATVDILVYFFMAVVFFKINFPGANWPGALLIFMLTLIIFISLGMLSTSFILVFKQGNPLGWLWSEASNLLGGVYFPIAVFPGWAQFVSQILPITHCLRALRLTLLQGYSLKQLNSELIILLSFALILAPLGLLVFRVALNKAKKDGSLIHY